MLPSKLGDPNGTGDVGQTGDKEMFNNLIESSSHAGEFKRRGSFVLFTTATYALLFLVAAVISIYAYDARLEEPTTEITMLSPVDLETLRSEPVRHVTAPPSGANHGGFVFGAAEIVSGASRGSLTLAVGFCRTKAPPP